MTVCVAVLCDEGRAIVLASDKMVGKGYIEGEPDIAKLQMIHPHWMMMLSGNDISPLMDLADLARSELPPTKEVSLETVKEVMQRNYELIRMKRAEATYLKPIGWTIDRFTKEGPQSLPNYEQIQSRVAEYELDVMILVAGFDRTLSPPGKIFTMSGENRGIPIRCDIPGFAAIGSGGIGAEYMLFFRKVSQNIPVRKAVYCALEAKYFGEQASGVGPRTDLFVLLFDGSNMRIVPINDERTIERKLIPVCEKLEPQELGNDEVDVLNSLRELKGLPDLPKKRASKTRKK
ncbi:MAG: hypothetical protein WBE97_16190 [Candidatus Acidiferrales bacterium]